MLHVSIFTCTFNSNLYAREISDEFFAVAAHKRQAALDEIQRLKIEGTLRPATPGYQELEEKGSLTISAITLPLKKDYFRNKDYGEPLLLLNAI